MQVIDPILEETLECLKYHYHPEWGDKSKYCVFQRLLAKMIRRPEWTKLDHEDIHPSHITSSREQWSTERLSIFKRLHDRCEPIKEDVPIIVVEYLDREWLLDGTTRINKWVNTSNSGTHDVHIHKIARKAGANIPQ